MKTRPILFSTPMVQAILEGRKTQTRRIINAQPPKNSLLFTKSDIDEQFFEVWQPHKEFTKSCRLLIKCPYGKTGDILWVRETFIDSEEYPCYDPEEHGGRFIYKADDDKIKGLKWKPSIFMPKEACRIFIKITDIRVERLNNISKQDAIAEGIAHYKEAYYFYPCNDIRDDSYIDDDPIVSYMSLWVSINGWKSWNNKPCVWVIQFERVDKPLTFI